MGRMERPMKFPPTDTHTQKAYPQEGKQFALILLAQVEREKKPDSSCYIIAIHDHWNPTKNYIFIFKLMAIPGISI